MATDEASPRRRGDVLGVVLAGGASRRMGRDKAVLAHADGGTFVRHAAETLRAVCDRIVISGDRRDDPVDVSDGWLPDDPDVHGGGPMGGILTGLRRARRAGLRGCVFVPVDAPEIDVDTVDRVSRWIGLGEDGCVLARGDRIEPLIGYYPTRSIDSILRCYRRQQRGVMQWIARQRIVTVSVPRPSVINVNRPDDYQGYVAASRRPDGRPA